MSSLPLSTSCVWHPYEHLNSFKTQFCKLDNYWRKILAFEGGWGKAHSFAALTPPPPPLHTVSVTPLLMILGKRDRPLGTDNYQFMDVYFPRISLLLYTVSSYLAEFANLMFTIYITQYCHSVRTSLTDLYNYCNVYVKVMFCCRQNGGRSLPTLRSHSTAQIELLGSMQTRNTTVRSSTCVMRTAVAFLTSAPMIHLSISSIAFVIGTTMSTVVMHRTG